MNYVDFVSSVLLLKVVLVFVYNDIVIILKVSSFRNSLLLREGHEREENIKKRGLIKTQ